MEDVPFYQKPWLRGLIFGFLLLGIYAYNIWQRGFGANILGIVFDAVALVLLLQVAIYFYAQFILPIRTLADRRRIFNRLWLHATNGHGPAIFVKNGRLVEREGESEKIGPGVLWLDTASAVVTRTPTAYKQVLGPGVHFIDRWEQIASVISLHTQSQTIGPHRDDAPFAKPKENASEEERKRHADVQARREAVSAMTRDGIEIIPNISVTFKIDARPAPPNEPGSRFGFDKEAVERAARGEGVNPDSISESEHHVPWNQLPAMIAADLWREYLSKFTLNQLFEASLDPLPEVPQPKPPAPPPEPPQAPAPVKSNFFANILRHINSSMEKSLQESSVEKVDLPTSEMRAAEQMSASSLPVELKKQTALQTIMQMMRARMTQAVVPVLDEVGRPVEGFVASDEFKKLKERGLAVSSVSVSALRFNPAIETQIVQNWTTNWLINAKADRRRIERLDLVYGESGRIKALQDHAFFLSQAVARDKPRDISSTVKTLLQRTQAEIKTNDGLLRRVTNEVEALDDIINWMESKEL